MKVVFCVLLVSAAATGQAPFASTDGSFRPRAVSEFLLKSGILLNLREFTDIPLAFTVLGPDSQPVPAAELALEFADSIARLRADSAGRIRMTFDSLQVLRDPVLRPVSAAQRVDFSFNLSRGKSSMYHHVNSEDLGRLRRMKSGDDLIWYPAGWDSVAGRLATFQAAARELIRSVTGFQPVRWGTVLSDKPLPLAVSPACVTQDGAEYVLFPFSMADESPEAWYLSNFRLWVDRTLRDNLPTSDPRTCWVFGGIAQHMEYLALAAIPRTDPARRVLTGRLRGRLGQFRDNLRSARPLESPPMGGGYDPRSHTALSYQVNEEWVLKTSLLDWVPADPRHPVSEQDFLPYQLAAWFWWDVSRRFGETVIADFLGRAQAAGARHNPELTSILTDLTSGLVTRNNLRDFPLDGLEQATSERLDEVK